MTVQTFNTGKKGNNVQAILKGAINTPKLTALAMAQFELQALASTGKLSAKAKAKCGYSALGHELGNKNSIIDACLLSSGCYSAVQYIQALIKSNIAVIKNDIAVLGYTVELDAWLAKRAIDHLKWCANTANKQHGGFYDRLQNVTLESKHAEIAKCIDTVYGELSDQFAIKFAGNYKKAKSKFDEYRATGIHKGNEYTVQAMNK